MTQADTPDGTKPNPSEPMPVRKPDSKGEPHPAIPQEDDPEIEKTEEQPS